MVTHSVTYLHCSWQQSVYLPLQLSFRSDSLHKLSLMLVRNIPPALNLLYIYGLSMDDHTGPIYVLQPAPLSLRFRNTPRKHIPFRHRKKFQLNSMWHSFIRFGLDLETCVLRAAILQCVVLEMTNAINIQMKTKNLSVTTPAPGFGLRPSTSDTNLPFRFIIAPAWPPPWLRNQRGGMRCWRKQKQHFAYRTLCGRWRRRGKVPWRKHNESHFRW